MEIKVVVTMSAYMNTDKNFTDEQLSRAAVEAVDSALYRAQDWGFEHYLQNDISFGYKVELNQG